MSPRPRRIVALWLTVGLLTAGCGQPRIDTTPGRSRGTSINGTGALAGMLRQEGHEVRTALRLTDTLGEWADVLVRFSLHPGLPDRDEGRWLSDWLQARAGRKVVYIPRDFDARSEFWAGMLAVQPKDAAPDLLEQIKKNRDDSASWVSDLPPKTKNPAPVAEWFSLDPKSGPPSTCKILEGPWAEGVDAPAAAVSKHEVFQIEGGEPVLLRGDGSPLAIEWTFDNGSRTLAVANASFLLNAALLNRARRPLAIRVVDWITSGTRPAHVGFVEGEDVLASKDDVPSSSPLHLFKVAPFGWVAVHLLLFLMALALAKAPRLGRARPEPPSGVERPSAHPEALGALLARTRQVDAARSLVETYRRWRHPAQSAGRTAPAPPVSPSSPRA